MNKLRIRCINKDNGNHDNPHEAITHYGWQEGNVYKKVDRQTMVDWVKDGNTVFVMDNAGNIAYCYVRISSAGTEFLQTYADGQYSDNLLRLPECR